MNNYNAPLFNFIPLPAILYEFDTFRVVQNTAIDIFQLGVNNERRGKDKEHYLIMLAEDKNQIIENVAIGFYNSKEPLIPIIIEGGNQQVVANFRIENGINYFVVVIANKGNTIEFYRSAYNKLFFVHLS